MKITDGGAGPSGAPYIPGGKASARYDSDVEVVEDNGDEDSEVEVLD